MAALEGKQDDRNEKLVTWSQQQQIPRRHVQTRIFLLLLAVHVLLVAYQSLLYHKPEGPTGPPPPVAVAGASFAPAGSAHGASVAAAAAAGCHVSLHAAGATAALAASVAAVTAAAVVQPATAVD